VTHRAVTAIIALCIAELDPLHDLGKPHRAGFYQEMNVIRHQHVGVNYAAITLSIMLDAFEVGDAVACVAKNIAPVITPGVVAGLLSFGPPRTVNESVKNR
jgi:hypothetical protein